MKTYKFYYLIIFLLFTFCSSDHEKYDIIILNGTIFDGSGSQGIKADLGISDDRIVKIGRLTGAEALKTINAEGLAIAPGFIDMHTHLEPIMRMPLMESLVRQGVTFALGGPDGGGPLPLGEYLDSLDQMGLGINVGYLVGHNSIRQKVMGMDDRAPDAAELDKMKSYVQEGMESGAFGISTGLKYLPGTFSELAEVIELSSVASERGGIYTSHLREEGLGLLDAVQEAIVISREAGIPVVLTHHKAIGVKMWGASKKTLAMVDSARTTGLDIMMDQYPYDASHTGISVLIPSWAMEANRFSERVNDPVLRDSIKAGIIFNILNDRGGNDLRRIQFSHVSWDRELEGKTMYDWAVSEGLEPTIENGADLVIRAQINGGTGTIFHAMDEKDVENIMKHPMTMTGSDGRLSQPNEGHPHPRAYGTFPRVLGYYVREKQIMPLETAIHKMTGLSANRLGLNDRGMIKEGYFADICIFDPQTIIDKSTFENPHQYPEGVVYVIVNGKMAVDENVFKSETSGKVVRHTIPGN